MFSVHIIHPVARGSIQHSPEVLLCDVLPLCSALLHQHFCKHQGNVVAEVQTRQQDIPTVLCQSTAELVW